MAVSLLRAAPFAVPLLALAACAPAPADAPHSQVSTEQGETLTGEQASESESDASEASTQASETGELPCPPAPCEACTCADGELSCACPPPPPEAGFIELEGVSYELGQAQTRVAAQSSAARWFWAYQGARHAVTPTGQDGAQPLFVFFNGGPGVSTGMLLGFNTGEASFAPAQTGPEEAVAPNSAPWTELGHLLWIDARQSGFSYGLLDDPSDAQARAAEVSLDNFNSYRDAADFVRVLLRFMAAHPELRDNPVVLVAESYGGTRAQIMLDMLLHPQAYADGSRHLLDPALASEIEAHHLAQGAEPDDPASLAAQFGRQVLIQPALTGVRQRQVAGELFEQPDSVLTEIADELGLSYPSCAEQGPPCDPYDHALDWVLANGRSPYDYRAPASWLSESFALVAARLNDPEASAQLLGVALETLPHFVPAGRSGAWRAAQIDQFPSDAELGAWPEIAGPLESWDRYFSVFNSEALLEFRSAEARGLDIDPGAPHFGELFLRNLLWVDTFITDASFDIVVYTPAIPLALAGYTELVDSIEVQPEHWQVEYTDALAADGPRSVFVPAYDAGHAVSLDLPTALRDEVAAWLQ